MKLKMQFLKIQVGSIDFSYSVDKLLYLKIYQVLIYRM